MTEEKGKCEVCIKRTIYACAKVVQTCRIFYVIAYTGILVVWNDNRPLFLMQKYKWLNNDIYMVIDFSALYQQINEV